MNELFEFFKDSDLESKIFQALGAASMCWSETPTGVFDSSRAREIGEVLLAEVRSYIVGADVSVLGGGA